MMANNGVSYSLDESNPNGNFMAERPAPGLMHNPGFDFDWTPEEKAILTAGLVEFAAYPLHDRYAMIAMQLPNKTVRDVALRSSWIRRKEASKKRNQENNSRKANEKIPETPAYPFAGLTCPNENLMKDNEKLFGQITSNLAGLKLHDNFGLFRLIQINILNILNNFHNDDAELMKSMPEIPVRMQEKYLAYLEHLSLKSSINFVA